MYIDNRFCANCCSTRSGWTHIYHGLCIWKEKKYPRRKRGRGEGGMKIKKGGWRAGNGPSFHLSVRTTRPQGMSATQFFDNHDSAKDHEPSLTWVSLNIYKNPVASECMSKEWSRYLNIQQWVKSLSRVWFFVTPWTVAYQAPPSMGFSRQEHCNGLPFPSPGDIPDPGTEPWSPALYADTVPSEPPGKPKHTMPVLIYTFN